ncbi:MAG TPA: alpha/beta hydrolase [Solirubrobacteraceae bacterium]|nr:alpha/beta hydrolase [Solirubrobacteraceae bacterium]
MAAHPPVVLVHGVGFGPGTLAELSMALAVQAPVLCLARRGYGDRDGLEPAASVDEHVEDVLGLLDAAGIDRAIIAGMSGGATVALATALTRPERVIVAVAHEPAVGSVAPELRALVRRALHRGGGRELLRVLAGEETWSALSGAAVAALEASTGLVEADAAAFLAFEPALGAFDPAPGVFDPAPRAFDPGPGTAGALPPLVCSVGERSSPLRYAVAERLAARTGAPVAVVPACGHLPQLDAPEAFAELILEHALINA